MPYQIKVNGQSPIEVDGSNISATDAKNVIENLMKEEKYASLIPLIQNNDKIKCTRLMGSNKKDSYLNKYLYLYEIFLSLFGVQSWQELKELYYRDEYGDISIDSIHKVDIDSDYLEKAIASVSSYEKELKKSYRDPSFSFTDYQIFAILFTELFLMQKEHGNKIFSFGYPANIDGIRVYSDEKVSKIIDTHSEEERMQLVAHLIGDLKSNGAPKGSFVAKYEKLLSIVNNENKTLQQALYEVFDILSISSYLQENNKLAYYMATGSGKTVILHTNILQAYKFFGKKSNFYLIVPTKELGKQHKKNLISFGFKESDIGFFEDEKSAKATVGKKVKEMMEASYPLKILTNSQLSAVNKQNIFFADKNIVFVDEGHKGEAKEEGWRKDRKSILGWGGFAFEYSATFSHAIKDNNKLLQEYSKAIIFDYAYQKFYTDGYGKQAEFEPKEIIKNDFDKELTDKESYKLFVKDIMAFLEQQLYFKDHKGKPNFEAYFFKKPLKLMICRRVDDANNESDVKKAITYIQNLSLIKQETLRYIKENLPYFSYISTMKPLEIYNAIFRFIFHAKSPAPIEIYELNSKELGIKVANAEEYFATVYVGEVSKIGISEVRKDPLQKSLIDTFFKSQDGDNPQINIVISARMLIEGWDTQRISSLSLFDFGKQEGSLIVQLFGRGVRLHGSQENRLKRSGEHPIMERFNIYGYDSKFLKTFINEAELSDISKDIMIEVYIDKNTDMLNKKLPIVKPKHSFSTLPYTYQYDKDITEELCSKMIKKYHLDKGDYSFSLLPLVDVKALYKTYIETTSYLNYHIPYADFCQTVVKIFGLNFRLKEKDQFKNVNSVEQMANRLVEYFFDSAYKLKKKQDELSTPMVEQLSEDDPNVNFEKYTISGTEERIANFIEHFEQNKGRFFISKQSYDRYGSYVIEGSIFSFLCDIHAYSPLLAEYGQLRISPDRLVESEQDFVHKVNKYLSDNDKNKSYQEIYLLRNQQKIGFNGYFPDFILWVIDRNNITHFVFIDPKGVSRLNVDSVWEKMLFSMEIKKVEKSIRKEYPNLRLHSFICATKSIDELSQDKVLSSFIGGKITTKFTGDTKQLSSQQLATALTLLNVLSIQDHDLIETIVTTVCKTEIDDSLKGFF
ncbi:DEAD/DEAH box helicase family protein [Sulfurovum indicum]|nr:DEAD/DEAH box helicase family protein [Sulfurovum indicum]QOR61173.1 DEAD/DEAH box helicase family protein [Sulfurovum indicum]